MNNLDKALLEELLGLVNIFGNKGNNIEEVQGKLAGISDIYAQLQDKNSIYNILDQMCSDIPEIYVVALEYLYAATKSESVLKKQLQVLTDGVKNGTIDLFCGIFYRWQIIRRIFLSYEGNQLLIERSEFNGALLQKMRQFIGMDLPVIEEQKRNKNRIVVIITQFLGPKHGPTRNALDYCYTMQKKMKKEVFLLAATEMPTEENQYLEYEAFGLKYGYFNYSKIYNGEFCISYLDEKINGYQCKVTRDNRDEIRNILQSIYKWNPFLVYNLGSENLIADFCSTFTTEVTLPFSYSFPITEGQFLILARKIEEKDKYFVDYLLQKDQKIIESIFVYKLEEPLKLYKKDDFGIDKDNFVIAVVGNRLEMEVDGNFIRILREILEQDSRYYVVFIGLFHNFEEYSNKIGFNNRVEYIGFQEDLRGVLNIADIYLNPPRKGGGTSAVEALAEGLPVISLPNCDVGYAVGESFVCNNVEEIPELVLKYRTDREFYQSQSNKAKFQASQVVNTEQVINNILENID